MIFYNGKIISAAGEKRKSVVNVGRTHFYPLIASILHLKVVENGLLCYGKIVKPLKSIL